MPRAARRRLASAAPDRSPQLPQRRGGRPGGSPRPPPGRAGPGPPRGRQAAAARGRAGRAGSGVWGRGAGCGRGDAAQGRGAGAGAAGPASRCRAWEPCYPPGERLLQRSGPFGAAGSPSGAAPAARSRVPPAGLARVPPSAAPAATPAPLPFCGAVRCPAPQPQPCQPRRLQPPDENSGYCLVSAAPNSSHSRAAFAVHY